jgi:hypothetical protein
MNIENIIKKIVNECIENYLIEELQPNGNELSSFLENLPSDENWGDEIYGALNGNEETIRLNLIDNGYCITVCMIVGWQFCETDIGNKIEFYLLDDGGTSYHCFVKYNNKFYDAYNYKGVSKLSDLQFCKIYMNNYSNDYLNSHLKFISRGEFDDAKADKLIWHY